MAGLVGAVAKENDAEIIIRALPDNVIVVTPQSRENPSKLRARIPAQDNIIFLLRGGLNAVGGEGPKPEKPWLFLFGIVFIYAVEHPAGRGGLDDELIRAGSQSPACSFLVAHSHLRRWHVGMAVKVSQREVVRLSLVFRARHTLWEGGRESMASFAASEAREEQPESASIASGTLAEVCSRDSLTSGCASAITQMPGHVREKRPAPSRS